ncbi:egg cell-secreted protein 1.1 [Manihot esculenta]|uniref:Uncharacterized protein n=2 Tax=Manihot esculenta TaxID=3983 RepID=A0ACB7G441_MANES|nr:egg cell-secreted protein 1.1 [Manihot esculenta]KAG8634649.1 hypothetical protein MANES_17G065250v8 [Manihot esculenta]KAG8634650.1 hypothetical protein MANES_17G065250v8 [Manihot esculenta]
MAYNLNLVLFIAILVAASCYYGAMAHPLAASSSSLIARLKLDEQSSGCWDSLIQLQACTGEIIVFFLNGETYLGQGCCRAVRTISRQCWPNMIDTLGFTEEEGDILEGYCIKDDNDGKSPPSSPLPHVVVPNLVVPKESSVP